MAGAFKVQGDWDNLTAFQNRSLQQGKATSYNYECIPHRLLNYYIWKAY